MLKNGTRRVYKKDVKERHPLIKDDLAKFVTEHPEVLEQYKKLKGAEGVLSGDHLEEGFDERALARALAESLSRVKTGNASASAYHKLMTGILTFIFYPDLIYPIKEREIHQGRKRVDIVFTNAARDGFFARRQISAQTRSSHVFVECKNYTYDVSNPEIDQLGGRFGHQRGFFGVLTCRKDKNPDATRDRCRDTAQDGRGYIIVLYDANISELLNLVATGHRDQVSPYMQRLFDNLVL